MSNRQSLSQQTGKIWLSIRKNKEIDIVLLNTYLSIYADEYAYICHKNDVQPVTGEIEGIHYHVLYNLKDKYKKDRLSTTLNRVVECLKLDNSFGVNIEKYDSFEGCLQYLTHKNDPSKTQHKIVEIVTNLNERDFELFYNCDLSNVFSFDLVLATCMQHNNKLGVINALWPYYSKDSVKHRVIDEIWKLSKEERGF